MAAIKMLPASIYLALVLFALVPVLIRVLPAQAEGDTRQLVEMPPMMQDHMLSNMRDHLAAVNEILIAMGKGEHDAAADIAEQRLGMSSLDDHGAHHMGKVMPQAMGVIGMSMHGAASRFARKAQEGDAVAAYRLLSDVTSACVTCHTQYRVK